jgi:hypothetical protein
MQRGSRDLVRFPLPFFSRSLLESRGASAVVGLRFLLRLSRYCGIPDKSGAG